MADCEAEQLCVSVKHGHDSLDVSLPAAARIKDLMERLQALTNVLPRGQKLIFKGKVLTADMTLNEAKIVSGSKIMMIANEGVHQGGVPLVKRSAVRMKDVRALTRSVITRKSKTSKMEVWKSTGIIPLSESELMEIPAEVWTLGASARVLDLSRNTLKVFPIEAKALFNLKRLNLERNSLVDGSIHWQALCSLRNILVLVLDDNCLNCLPPEIQELSALKQLSVSNNQLTMLPEEIGKLSQLETLELKNNRLTHLPSTIGLCTSLIEVDLSANYLTAIPSSIGDLQSLKALNLDNNALKDFPANVLKGCVELTSLSLHGNEITVEALRAMDGWREFDDRRKSKYNKQLDFQVMGSSHGFDEGADTQQTQHW